MKKLLLNSSGKILKSNTGLLCINSDAHAIRLIKTIENINLAYNSANGDLVINFTPLTDQKLLSQVQNHETDVRVQLLVHQQSADSYVFGSVSIPTSEFPPRNNPQSDIYVKKRMARRRSCDTEAQGFTWLSLSADNLRYGQAILHAENQATASISAANQRGLKGGYVDIYVAVEIYVPAFGPGTNNMFDYVNNLGAHKISNVIAVPKVY